MSFNELASEGVRIHRLVQKQGEFMVIYPQTFTATICCGYNISESIRFATLDWIPTGYQMCRVRACWLQLYASILSYTHVVLWRVC